MKTPKKPIHVLFAAAEADPYIKIGGLGDVAGSLPLAIRQFTSQTDSVDQVDIRVVIPYHRSIPEKFTQLVRLGSYLLESGDKQAEVQVYEDKSAPLPIYFLDGDPIRQAAGIYSLDSSQDAEKYIFFSLAVLKLPRFLEWPIDILHANDWHTAASVYALKALPGFQESTIRTVLSIHNLPYLGEGSQEVLKSWHVPSLTDEKLPDWAQLLPLPLGIATADRIIPVSPGYAREILTPNFSSGLEILLRSRSDHILGIINGINQEQWNPATDPYISSTYDPDHLQSKTPNKTGLMRSLGLDPNPDLPLVTMVTRMDYQKGVDIALSGLEVMLDQPWQAVILGSGDPALTARCSALQEAYPDRVRFIPGFNPEFSHQLYAAADIFLMSSRYEPCGISQLISMRYGTIPVAHATGGLIDTITPTLPENPGTGYLYETNTPDFLVQTIHQALLDYNRKDFWHKIQTNAMQQDFSWKMSAGKYVQQYQNLLATNPILTIQEE